MSLCPLDSTTCGGRGRERKNEAYQGPVAMSRGEVQLLGPSSYNSKTKRGRRTRLPLFAAPAVTLPLYVVHVVAGVQREDVGLVRVVLIVRVICLYPQQNLFAFRHVVDRDRLARHRVNPAECNLGRVGQERTRLRAAVGADVPVLQPVRHRADLGRPRRVLDVTVDSGVDRRGSRTTTIAVTIRVGSDRRRRVRPIWIVSAWRGRRVGVRCVRRRIGRKVNVMTACRVLGIGAMSGVERSVRHLAVAGHIGVGLCGRRHCQRAHYHHQGQNYAEGLHSKGLHSKSLLDVCPAPAKGFLGGGMV